MAAADDLKAAILDSADLKPERVPTPEWEGAPCVWCRGLTGDELVRLGSLEDPSHEMREAVAMTLCTEDGAPLGFTALETAALGQKSASALKRVYDRVMHLSGLTEAAREALRGNSPAAPGDATG